MAGGDEGRSKCDERAVSRLAGYPLSFVVRLLLLSLLLALLLICGVLWLAWLPRERLWPTILAGLIGFLMGVVVCVLTRWARFARMGAIVLLIGLVALVGSSFGLLLSAYLVGLGVGVACAFDSGAWLAVLVAQIAGPYEPPVREPCDRIDRQHPQSPQNYPDQS